MLFIQSKTDGFRRCGVVHSSKGKEFPDDQFTEEELEILNNDPDIIMVAGDPDGSGNKPPEGPSLEDLVDAGKKAIEDGKTIGSGAPDVAAMTAILKQQVTAAQRDEAWAVIQKEAE